MIRINQVCEVPPLKHSGGHTLSILHYQCLKPQYVFPIFKTPKGEKGANIIFIDAKGKTLEE